MAGGLLRDSSSARNRVLAALALVLLAFLWGGSFVVVKAALATVPPLRFLALRFTLAAAVLAMLLLPRQTRARGALFARGGLVVGAALLAGYVFQTVGLQSTTPARSAFITCLYIPLVPLAASFVYRRWPDPWDLVAAIVSAVGMALLTIDGPMGSFSYADLLTFGGAVAYAFHLVALGHFAVRLPYESLAVAQLAVVGLASAGASAVLESGSWRLSGEAWAAVAATGLLATALAFALQSWAQQYASPARTAVLLALEPVFAWILAFLYVGERLSVRGAAGAAVIVAGVFLAELKPRSSSRHPS